MRIIILGAGQVGGTLAKYLVNEDNDITLIDVDENKLHKLQDKLDIQTVVGSGSHPNILIDAGIKQADMLIAVTNSDEVNMIGCFNAYNLFQTPSKIARIRSENYFAYPKLFASDAIPIDVCISPESLVKEHITNLIQYPGTTQILEFANGQLLFMTIRVASRGELEGMSVARVNELLSNLQINIVAIFRNKAAISITDDLSLIARDVIFFVVTATEIGHALSVLGCNESPNKRIIIAGGGNIGRRLAMALEVKYQVKIIEHNTSSAIKLAEDLTKATVLDGDIADKDLLLNENIEFTDVFCAVTNDDEANIMAALQAKSLGVKYTMALVNRDAYVDLIEDSSIDYAISPQLITIGSILTKLRRGNMVKVQPLGYGEAEVIELIIHGSETTSQVIGRRVGEIPLPLDSSIAAVVRESKVNIVDNNFILQDKDHVVIFLQKRRLIRQVESLFQVNLSFMN